MTSRKRKLLLTATVDIEGNIAADELNKHGFDPVTIEGGYSAYRACGNKK